MGLRDDFIRNIIKISPDMKVHFIDKVNNNYWPSEKNITDLNNTQRAEFNLRKQFTNEIILDIEEKYKLDDIITKLTEKNWSYDVWDTGSRGIHISIKFDNLKDYDIELRNRIRKYIITDFDTDIRLASEGQWLALEWTKHFKTGNEKVLIDKINNGQQNIPADIIDYCAKEIKTLTNIKISNKKLLIDYHKKDPYLKYVMENLIERGDRNNILFKNIAIGLSQSGLTREEINVYAQQIVKNCPGKNVSEFMGWVDKAMQGHLTDYNKYELMKWSIKYNYPILYELEEGEDIIDLLTIKQLWDKIWNFKISSQEVWKDLCFYNLIGTILDEKEEDYRIHLIFSSDSGSGKDEGINIILDILERLQMIIHTPATVTDKTLIGGINEKVSEYNAKYGLTEEAPTKGKHEYKDPIDHGWLASANWMACSEAEFIFKPGPHNKHIQLIFRQAMDKSRRIEKGVAGKSIPLTTNTSLIFTTYKMDSILNSILHNGLFQRALFYDKNLTEAEHKHIRKHVNKFRFNNDFKKTINVKKYMSVLIQRLKEMKKWYIENRNNFKFTDGADKFVDNLWEKLEESYTEYMPADKTILNSMVRRSANNLYKLSILNATWNMNSIIKNDMIRECFNLTSTCIFSIRDLMLNKDKSKKVKHAILSLISKSSICKTVLYNYMDTKLKIKSAATQTRYVKQLIDSGFLTTFRERSKDMLLITEKGREAIDTF